MSPRASSSTSSQSQRITSTPYSRRPTSQPKSSRQQFSACGACRMRRVRCDLKDLPFTPSIPHPACSNCKERGLKCVDEFAEVKAVKLLRRGRRLQQVEAIYGKAQNGTPSSSLETRLPSTIPQLTTEFFSSSFWKWFTVQRPILDPVEFPARFLAHTKGVHSLGNEGGLLAMVLVVWAASFGLTECGLPEIEDDNPSVTSHEETSLTMATESSLYGNNISPDAQENPLISRHQRKGRKDKVDNMLREILELIDFHGVMRRPTWDGVRVLLLMLPLMEEAHPLERLAMQQAAFSQTQALCTLSGPSTPVQSYLDDSDDVLVRAQIFWYAHTHEGITTGMRGGRLVLNVDDLDAFQTTLPSSDLGGSGFPSAHPAMPSIRPLSGHGVAHAKPQCGSTAQSFLHLSQLFSLPLQLSAICRKVHLVLTGPKAVKRAEEHGLVDAHGMREIWDDLDYCWKAFDAMRTSSSDNLDIEQYVSAWQIFIFECHNMIRESLKQHMCSTSNNSQIMYHASSSSRPSSSSSPYLSPHYLHVTATRKCLGLLPLVLRIIKFHLSEEKRAARGLFKWDAGLVREGCFFAGFLAASVEGETIDFPTEDRDEEHTRGRSSWSVSEGLSLCLTALAEMRWAFSRSDEREETIRMVWDSKKVGRNPSRYSISFPDRLTNQGSDAYSDVLPPMELSRPMSMSAAQGPSAFAHISGSGRPLLPPLHLLCSPRRAESAPSTAYTTGHGANGWPSYTPPGTATSIATSAGTGISTPGSPQFASLAGSVTFKNDSHESFYEVHQDLDQFSFNVPVTGPDGTIGPGVHYHHRDPPSSAHSLHSTSYLDSSVFSSQGSSMIQTGSDRSSCPQFGDNPHGFYH